MRKRAFFEVRFLWDVQQVVIAADNDHNVSSRHSTTKFHEGILPWNVQVRRYSPNVPLTHSFHHLLDVVPAGELTPLILQSNKDKLTMDDTRRTCMVGDRVSGTVSALRSWACQAITRDKQEFSSSGCVNYVT